MSLLSSPYFRTEFGYKVIPPRRPSATEPTNSLRATRELVAPPGFHRDLLPTELADIQRQAARVEPALAALERQHNAIEDLRLTLRVVARSFASGFVVSGLWTRTTAWLRWGMGESRHLSARRAEQIDRAISAKVADLKRITERVVMPSIAVIREEYRGRTFTRDANTPKALLHVSVPEEKVGTIVSFDSFRLTVDTRSSGSNATCDLSRGEGRIVLERIKNGVREQLEFSYKRPGKVDVYVNGERRGAMWNDDALTVADAFAAGRSIPLEKRTRSERYVVN